MELVGIHCSKNSQGEKLSTLHVLDNFPQYYSSANAGRDCVGKKAETIFVGTYDISDLQVGMEIEIYYDKAVTTAKGTFQTIKKIEIL